MGSMGKKPKKSEPAQRRTSPGHLVSWFEIPVHDMERAVEFYNLVFSVELEVNLSGEHAMAFFPTAEGAVGGALVKGPGSIPSGTGTLAYLNAGSDLPAVLALVEQAGGRVVMGETTLGDAGHFALFLDTEGNKLALHYNES